MVASSPRTRIADAIGDLTVPAAVELLRDVADRLASGRPVADPPAPRLLVVAGCPSEYAYHQHLAAGERCTPCERLVAALVVAQRNADADWGHGA
jgi:hypothetical protein